MSTEEKLALATQALEFYANGGHFQDNADGWNCWKQGGPPPPDDVVDHGERARAALEKIMG